jgi:pimeloyl-ACP methyl ester carboxylesterase
MVQEILNHTIKVNNINLHYRDVQNDGKEIILMMHGLTANCHAFDGLLKNGLGRNNRIIIPDLRGRGLSDRPSFGYSMKDHCNDIIAFLDALKINKVILIGHSFGGLLALFIAERFPEKVSKLVIIDAAAKMNNRAVEMLSFAVGRLDKRYKNWDEYIGEVKAAPYLTFWDDAMEGYYRADLMPTTGEGVTPISNLTNIAEASFGVATTPWENIIKKIDTPAILINGLDAYSLGEPLLPENKALQTVDMMRKCTYIATTGNHITMLYGEGAKEVNNAILEFIN